MPTPVPPNMEQLAEQARKLELAVKLPPAERDVILANTNWSRPRRNEKKVGAATAGKLEAAAQSAEGARRRLHADRPEISDHQHRPPARAGALDRLQRTIR